MYLCLAGWGREMKPLSYWGSPGQLGTLSGLGGSLRPCLCPPPYFLGPPLRRARPPLPSRPSVFLWDSR